MELLFRLPLVDDQKLSLSRDESVTDDARPFRTRSGLFEEGRIVVQVLKGLGDVGNWELDRNDDTHFVPPINNQTPRLRRPTRIQQ